MAGIDRVVGTCRRRRKTKGNGGRRKRGDEERRTHESTSVGAGKMRATTHRVKV